MITVQMQRKLPFKYPEIGKLVLNPRQGGHVHDLPCHFYNADGPLRVRERQSF